MSENLSSKASTRKRGLMVVGLVVGTVAIVWGGYQFFYGKYHISTDNAYVAGNVIQITPQVSGTVVSIQADETDFVKAGELLVKIDPADAKVALEQARAQLEQTIREVKTLFANNEALRAQVNLREADFTKAEVELARAQDDVKRRTPLLNSGAVGQEEFNHVNAQLASAKSSAQAAQSAVIAAKEQLLASLTQTEGTTVEHHPNVERAAARYREAYLALERVELVSPIDGHIAKRGVQVGQRVQAGSPLMTIVALNQLWVDANFKESQLQDIRIGQPVELEADVYGQKTVFHGKVAGLGAGTGSAFSLLPAQNATGNWIKVVQRVPVRIALDDGELAKHPLRVGLSMDVTIDTKDQTGKALADMPRTTPTSATTVYEVQSTQADEEVKKILAAQLSRSAAQGSKSNK
jgi:membrane fusion protein (multidrug efflux system)